MTDQNYEFSGKSVEDAIEKGLAELGLERAQASIQVVREASRGMLGIGGEGAIVRLTPAARPAESVDPSKATPDQIHSESKEILETILRGMGFQAHVEVLPDIGADDQNAFVLNIIGDDLGVLIGRRGETLRDLEFVARLMSAQRLGKQPKLAVDVEGYRGRRERQLSELAKRMAERVQSNRQPITLEAMPPNERRIVHITLRDHPVVKTQSIGEGEHRRVMILPK
jgi:spoIIIJ-associated protein